MKKYLFLSIAVSALLFTGCAQKVQSPTYVSSHNNGDIDGCLSSWGPLTDTDSTHCYVYDGLNSFDISFEANRNFRQYDSIMIEKVGFDNNCSNSQLASQAAQYLDDAFRDSVARSTGLRIVDHPLKHTLIAAVAIDTIEMTKPITGEPSLVVTIKEKISDANDKSVVFSSIKKSEGRQNHKIWKNIKIDDLKPVLDEYVEKSTTVKNVLHSRPDPISKPINVLPVNSPLNK
jgi:hypothetical protein